jgi:hypothetical protein
MNSRLESRGKTSQYSYRWGESNVRAIYSHCSTPQRAAQNNSKQEILSSIHSPSLQDSPEKKDTEIENTNENENVVTIEDVQECKMIQTIPATLDGLIELTESEMKPNTTKNEGTPPDEEDTKQNENEEITFVKLEDKFELKDEEEVLDTEDKKNATNKQINIIIQKGRGHASRSETAPRDWEKVGEIADQIKSSVFQYENNFITVETTLNSTKGIKISDSSNTAPSFLGKKPEGHKQFHRKYHKPPSTRSSIKSNSSTDTSYINDKTRQILTMHKDIKPLALPRRPQNTLTTQSATQSNIHTRRHLYISNQSSLHSRTHSQTHSHSHSQSHSLSRRNFNASNGNNINSTPFFIKKLLNK